VATEIGIGFSQEMNPEQAAKDAAFQSKTHLNVDRIDLAIIISSVHYDPKVTLPVFQTVLNNAKIIGCSSAGIILQDSIKTRGILVITTSSEDTKFGIGAVNNITSQNIRQMGTSLAQNCMADFGQHARQLFLFFFDGSLENVPLLVEGIQDNFGKIFPIIGAGSCDDFHFENTFQIFQNKILRYAAAGIIFGEHMGFAFGVSHGWKPLGKPRTVTKSEGNIIKTIDNKPAVKLYEEYLGKDPRSLNLKHFDRTTLLYPLGIFVEENKKCLLRNAVDIQANGSIVCQGDVSEGAEIHIMIGNKESCKQAAKEAAEEAKKNLLGKEPRILVIIESMARLKLLGRSALDEIKEIKKVFGEEVPLIGMYSNGEICPTKTSEEKYEVPHVQSESIIVLALT